MKNHWKNNHQFIKGIAEFFASMVLIGLISVFFQATVTNADFSPFFGYDVTVVSRVVPIFTIPGAQLACPYYFLVKNNFINPETPYPEFGLFVFPGGEGLTYDNRSLSIPLSRHLGGYIPFPNAACGVTPIGTPIFPIFNDFPFYLDGGTLGPSIP